MARRPALGGQYTHTVLYATSAVGQRQWNLFWGEGACVCVCGPDMCCVTWRGVTTSGPPNYLYVVIIWMVLSAMLCLCCLTCTTRR
jgi:hypothetical protein